MDGNFYSPEKSRRGPSEFEGEQRALPRVQNVDGDGRRHTAAGQVHVCSPGGFIKDLKYF